MIRAIIFDVDGVLVDSTNANVALFQNVLKKADYPIPSRDEILACFHMPALQTIAKLTGSEDEEEVKKIWEFVKDGSTRQPELFEFPTELEKTLERFHKEYRLAIVTSRIKVGMEEVFSMKEIKHLFDVVVTFEDYKNPKPHPEPLLTALEKLHLSPNEAIYIGDSLTDIEASKAAGVKSIFLTIKPHEDATINIRKFKELPVAVAKISNPKP